MIRWSTVKADIGPTESGAWLVTGKHTRTGKILLCCFAVHVSGVSVTCYGWRIRIKCSNVNVNIKDMMHDAFMYNVPIWLSGAAVPRTNAMYRGIIHVFPRPLSLPRPAPHHAYHPGIVRYTASAHFPVLI